MNLQRHIAMMGRTGVILSLDAVLTMIAIVVGSKYRLADRISFENYRHA